MYIVMRCEEVMCRGNYKSKASIIGIRSIEESAIELLDAASKFIHGDEKPIEGRFNSKGNIEVKYGDVLITDRFWIENRSINDFDEYCFFHPIELFASETPPIMQRCE